MSFLLLHLITPVLGHVLTGFLPLAYLLLHTALVIQVFRMLALYIFNYADFLISNAIADHLLERNILDFFHDAIALPRVHDLVSMLFWAEVSFVG